MIHEGLITQLKYIPSIKGNKDVSYASIIIYKSTNRLMARTCQISWPLEQLCLN